MKGGIEALRAIIAAEPLATGAGASGGSKHRAEHYDFYVARDLPKWEAMKTLVADGECAKLVQFATGAPLTSYWVRGPRVKGNAKIPKGAAIAVFDSGGFYSSDGSMPRHAAIYLGQDSKGLRVLDQWKGRNVSAGFARPLLFGNSKNGWTVNDGDHFHLVLSAKFTEWDWAMAGARGASAGF